MTPKYQEQIFKKEYARELLVIAEGDLASAAGLMKINVGRKENICFLAQQSIEKALKAILCWNEVPIPMVHDAGILVAKMPRNLLVPKGYDLSVLTTFATVRRYEEGPFNLTEKELAAVVATAENILSWAKQIVP